jgi:hypothetical protein
VEIAGLWYFLVNWLAENRLEDPKLPESVHFRVTGEAPELRVEVYRVPPLPNAEITTTSPI